MSRPSGFDRFRASAAVLLALVAAPLAPAQVLSDNFGSGTLNPATWFQDKTIANLSAVPANGRLEFRATANGSIPGETLNYAATSLEPGIGTVSGSQVSVKMNLTKATPAQSNWDEGLAVLFTDVETEAPSLNELPPSFVFAIGSYKELAAGPQVRYMVLMSIDDAGQETEYWYAEESPSGKFTNALPPDPDVTGSTVTVPSTGAIPVFFSLVEGATSWTLRVGFTSFSNTANSFSVKLSLDDVGDRPYRPSLVGYLNGPINVALTGARSHFDDFVVQQGVLSRRPEGLTASQGTSLTAVNLSWTAASGATSYRVYRTSNLTTPIATVSGTSYADTSAVPGVPTEYCVRAFSATAGLSEHGDFVTGTRKAPVPTVTAVTPASGPLAGGTTITVTGTGFVPGLTTVKVGTATATTVVVNSARTSLTAKAPAGTAGAKSVSVTTSGGTATKASAFTYVAAPTVSAVSPAYGPLAGNTSITVTGTNLAGATVKVGTGTATTVVVNSAGTSLTAKTPAGTAGAKTVTVTTAGGTATKASAFTYLAVPTIGTVTPASGPTAGNTTITVTGTGFKSGQTTVKVGTGTATTVVVNSAGTSLTAKTPAGTAGAKTVTVTTPGGTATKASAFTYTAGAGMPTPPGGGTGGGTDGGSSSAGMSTAQGPGSVGGGSSAGAGSTAGGRSARSTWLPDTGIPALDGYLVLSGAEATVGSGCGDAPASDLDADGEADLCQLRRGDLDLDGDVDAIDADLVMLLVGRESADGIADLDGDGWVTPVDAAIARSGGATLASTPR
jgi:hypothetical protein